MSGSTERYTFSPFTLDASERLLLRGREPLPLRDKVFDTLLILIRNAGRLVTKEELLETIWPDTHVDETNLNQNISVIRRALGDGQYIQTVQKRGFRFVVPVTRVETKAAAESTMRRRVSQLAVFAALVVAAIALPIGSDHARSGPQPLRSVAVVPFRLLSASPTDAYVAASVSETLTNRLSAIPSLLVRPAGASNNADAVLTGAVQPNGETIRITAELVDTRRKVTMWSRAFDCTTADLLTIEDALSADVAVRLSPGLTTEERARLTPPHSGDAVANDEYLRGREVLDRRGPPAESILHFEKALARDPQFALAWAGLAEALTHPEPQQSTDVIARASDAARRAIRLDPTLAEGHAVLGFIHLFYEWQWTAAERELRVALHINPGSARIHDWYALALLTRGDTAGAVSEIRRAHAIDPQSPDIAADVALIELESRDYRAAETAAREALALGPQTNASAYLVGALKMQQRTAEALAELEGSPLPGVDRSIEAAFLRSHDRKTAIDAIHRAGSSVMSESPNSVAALYARAGDKEKALQWLERAYREHAFGLMFLGVAPEFDSLRGDSRFRDLVRRVGVVEPPNLADLTSSSAARIRSSKSAAR